MKKIKTLLTLSSLLLFTSCSGIGSFAPVSEDTTQDANTKNEESTTEETKTEETKTDNTKQEETNPGGSKGSSEGGSGSGDNPGGTKPGETKPVETKKYTITWVVNGVNTTTTVEEGKVPEYKGTTPTKAKTAEYTYTFVGWNTSSTATSAITLPKVTQNQTYYAIFSKTKNKYKITFKVEGQADKQVDFEYGAMPSYGSTPTKETEAGTYEFLRWEPEIKSVTANATYTAVFNTQITPKKCKITFALADDIIVKTVEYAYNTRYNDVKQPSPFEILAKTDDKMRFVSNGVTYDFKGWPTRQDVTGDKTYYAVKEAVTNPESKTKYFAFMGISSNPAILAYTKTLAEGAVDIFDKYGKKEDYTGAFIQYGDDEITLRVPSGYGQKACSRYFPGDFSA